MEYEEDLISGEAPDNLPVSTESSELVAAQTNKELSTDVVDPTSVGYRPLMLYPVEAKRNYSVISVVLMLYNYYASLLLGLIVLVAGEDASWADNLFGWLLNAYTIGATSLVAVVFAWITLRERRQMAKRGWLACNSKGLPMGRTAARLALWIGLAHLILIIVWVITLIAQ